MPFRLYFHSLTSLESTISNSAFPGVSDVEFVQCRALVGKAAQASKPFFSPLTIPALLRSFPHLPRLLSYPCLIVSQDTSAAVWCTFACFTHNVLWDQCTVAIYTNILVFTINECSRSFLGLSGTPQGHFHGGQKVPNDPPDVRYNVQPCSINVQPIWGSWNHLWPEGQKRP